MSVLREAGAFAVQNEKLEVFFVSFFIEKDPGKFDSDVGNDFREILIWEGNEK